MKSGTSEYISTHMWVKYHYGKADKCENCKTTEDRLFQWSNISGQYLRIRRDWQKLCVPCHKRYDVPQKTQCKRGHEYTEENTYWDLKGSYICRACHRLNQKEYKLRRKLMPQIKVKYVPSVHKVKVRVK